MQILFKPVTYCHRHYEKKWEKTDYENIAAICEMRTDLFYGLSGLKHSHQVDLVQNLCVGHDKTPLIAETSVLLQHLDPVGLKCERSCSLFFGIPLSIFELWVSPFFITMPCFALNHSGLCLLSLQPCQSKASLRSPVRSPLPSSVFNKQLKHATLHLILSNNTDLSTSPLPFLCFRVRQDPQRQTMQAHRFSLFLKQVIESHHP